MDKGSLPVHEVKLEVESAPCRLYGSRVGDHTDRPRHLCQGAPRHGRHGAGIDTHLEACRGPLHKLNGPLGLHDLNGGVDILGDGVPSEE